MLNREIEDSKFSHVPRSTEITPNYQTRSNSVVQSRLKRQKTVCCSRIADRLFDIISMIWSISYGVLLFFGVLFINYYLFFNNKLILSIRTLNGYFGMLVKNVFNSKFSRPFELVLTSPGFSKIANWAKYSGRDKMAEFASFA